MLGPAQNAVLLLPITEVLFLGGSLFVPFLGLAVAVVQAQCLGGGSAGCPVEKSMLGVAELRWPLEMGQIARDLLQLSVLACRGDEGIRAFCMAWGCLDTALLCIHLSFPLPPPTTKTPLPGVPAPCLLIVPGTCTLLFPGDCLRKPIAQGHWDAPPEREDSWVNPPPGLQHIGL